MIECYCSTDMRQKIRIAEGVIHKTVGDEMGALADELGKSGGPALGKAAQFTHCPDTAAAIAALVDLGLESGDVILVKGSNSVGLAKLVAALQIDTGVDEKG